MPEGMQTMFVCFCFEISPIFEFLRNFEFLRKLTEIRSWATHFVI